MADITYYVALPFVWIGGGLFPAEAEECPNLATAIARADVLALVPENAGVVAYCRTFDPDRGISGEAVIVRRARPEFHVIWRAQDIGYGLFACRQNEACPFDQTWSEQIMLQISDGLAARTARSIGLSR